MRLTGVRPVLALGCGVDQALRRCEHVAMDTPNNPRETQDAQLDAKVQAWLELKREMETLHAQVE
jgi:hypothetical protein